MKSLFILLIAFTLFADQLYFLPFESKQALRKLYRTLDNARSTIDIAMYSFTNRSLAKKLKNAAKRGVKVRVLLDYDQNVGDRYSQIGYLAKYRNILVYTIRGKRIKNRERYGKMHIKLAIVDGRTLIFGSANWSYSAFGSNYELLYFVEDYAMAKKSEKMFEKMLRKAKRY